MNGDAKPLVLLSGRPRSFFNGKHRYRRLFWCLAAILVSIGIICICITVRALKPRSLHEYMSSMHQIVFAPQAGFAGRRHILILCLGIDDNAVFNNRHGDIVYGNSDTILLLDLDLVARSAAVLSIPRDCYAHIAGTLRSTKINQAYAHGGVDCAVATIHEFIGGQPDYTATLSISDLQRLVDALGGIDLTVEHAMHYDDNWGHLHIHLEPGYQHLSGEQTLGFIRFRHAVQNGKVVVTPEHGDQRRIYRQQVALHAIVHRLNSPYGLLHCNKIFDVLVDNLHTRLTRTQMLDLVALFRGMPASNIDMIQLPATNFTAPDGGKDLWANKEDREACLKRLLRYP